jgi:transposase-like protein
MAHEPKTLQEAIQYFADSDNCLNYLVARRWKDGVVCPTCGSREVSFMPSRRVWQCKGRHAKCQFSVKVGTVFEESPIGLDKWLTAMWMMANCRNGVSSWEIHRTLGVTQKSAWFMLQRIRFAMQSGSSKKFGGPGNAIEADECFVGGKAKNMHASKRAQFKVARDCGTPIGDSRLVNKSTVWGILDREQRQIRATIVPKVNREGLQQAVLSQIEHGTKVYTDEAAVYRGLPKEFTHEFVNHLEKYVNGQVHTNGLENFWSLTKRTLAGTYVSVEPFHLHRYLDEAMFRYNNRLDENGNKLTDAERFSLVVSQVVGKRLTYAEVTGKTTTTPF